MILWRQSLNDIFRAIYLFEIEIKATYTKDRSCKLWLIVTVIKIVRFLYPKTMNKLCLLKWNNQTYNNFKHIYGCNHNPVNVTIKQFIISHPPILAASIPNLNGYIILREMHFLKSLPL